MIHDHRAASAKTYFDLGLAVEHSDFFDPASFSTVLYWKRPAWSI